ncbi:hypothetical protein [Methylobacterium fujisawaense]|uniref:hypothetical protein n=1 Tax=Methylobacterium fujisawaense TaxID=107400 RepID=UPI002448D4FB|nr:hypothetical protein [Methylobacterium fujisawaense]MDH3028643.1 hypothetical protein [Methylobacterium fujisawaense]
MTPAALTQFGQSAAERHAAILNFVDSIDVASDTIESTDHQSDAFAEAIFLRAFTHYESSVETLFLHYVTGGVSLSGGRANTYLSIQDEGHARRLTKAGNRFLSWAKPTEIRTTAQNYIENGWPLVDMMAAKEQALADCERVRNRIAHNSFEAAQQFSIVQRNMLGTERLFDLSPGQFLRIRSVRHRKTHLKHYIETLYETLEALLDPR